MSIRKQFILNTSHSTVRKMNDMEELCRLLSVQFRSLMAAQTVDSDLDLAYRFQLQEAIAASLALQPSSSASSLKSPQPPPPTSIDAGINLADLQTLGLDKLEPVTEDHVVTKTETKKMQVYNYPNRQIHDQKLAPEILRMRKGRDSFQLPYGEGSSSSKSEDDPEVFRVYFKVLLSEERVPDPGASSSIVTVAMAGIGVAVLDSSNELRFGVMDPLDLNECDQMSRQSVELQALIEALKVAIALNLNRIVFYCDYYPLYQYVRGRWQPKQKKIINSLDQVRLLQKRFIYCEPSLIASKNVKFAYMFARKAIDSQISKLVSSRKKLEQCVICLEDKSVDQFFSIEGCRHQYCYSCIKQHVEVKLLQRVLPKCPHEGCENELGFESCEKFLTRKFAKMMREQMKENSIPVTEKVYCPYPNCSALMSKTEPRLPRLAYGCVARTCYKCHGNFCLSCRVPWHENMSCAEFKRRNSKHLVEESKLKNLAARKSWRQCIKCKHMIELAAGCYHITCRCGYEFCYTCGAEWKNKKATCSCPLWVEANIMNREEEEEDDEDDSDDFEDQEEDDDVFEAGDVSEYDDDTFRYDDRYCYDEEYDRYW